MMKEIDFIIKHWPKHKQDEVYAVKRFLDNSQEPFELSSTNVDHNAPEPIDIWVKDINKKFQVVVANFKLYKKVGRAKPDSNGVKFVEIEHHSIQEVLEEYVYKPLRKKNKYGDAAKGIILLIDAPFDPPIGVEKVITKLREVGNNKELKQLGFEAIYLVCSKNNIQLYP